jgi:hypothetical protein
MDMFGKIKNWVRSVKLKYAIRWVDDCGLSVVRIVERAGSQYIVAQDGSFRRVGKRIG